MDEVVSTHAVFDDTTGEHLFNCAEADIPDGASYVALPEGFTDFYYEWDDTTRTYVEDLASAKEDFRSKTKGFRDFHKEIGITVSGIGPVKTDLGSRMDILEQARKAALVGVGFEISWVLADGSVVLIEGAEMQAIADAVSDHMDACQAYATELIGLIDSATSLEQLRDPEYILIEAGWPT